MACRGLPKSRHAFCEDGGMARTHVRRRSRARHSVRGDGSTSLALPVLGTFLLGMALEWLRSAPPLTERGWRWDTVTVLVAAWLTVVVIWRAPDGANDRLFGGATVGLVVLFLGSLLMHELLNPH